ncbi:MAG: ROK family protein [Acidobacteria bacterium]|nr:ROK family protein [Acidobacteriota bacterium]
MSYAIGIDLGGTNIKAVAVNEDGDVLARTSAPTHGDGVADEDGAAVARNVARQLAALETEVGRTAAAVGLAAPGLVARDGRSMASISGHLESVEGLVWAEYLGGRAPALLNDAHAALVGEVWRGAAAGARDAVLLTLGTGVGGAVLAEGRLLRGHLGRAGHLGHMCLDVDGARDSLGIPGTLEEAVGNRTLPERSAGRFRSTAELVAAYLAGDAEAARVWLRSVFQLACAVTNIINAFDPEVFIIGGGVARAGRALFDPLAEYLDGMEWRPQGHRVRVVPAALGDAAGALGAARNAEQSSSGSSNQQ